MTTLFNWSSHGGQNEDRMLLQRSQRWHRGEFRHVSISTQQRSLRCWQNLRGPFLRATLPMTVRSCARAMVDNGKTKGLITPPPRWVSAQLLYVCVTTWQRSRLWSQNLCSLFLRAVRLFIYITLINYITRHNFSPTRSVMRDLFLYYHILHVRAIPTYSYSALRNWCTSIFTGLWQKCQMEQFL